MKRRAFLGGVAATLAVPLTASARLMAPPPAMPALYVAHGGPNLAVSQVRAAPLIAWGEQLPTPTGYLGITPHIRSHGLHLSAIGPGRALVSFPPRFLPNADSFSYATPDSHDLADTISAVLPDATRGGEGINHTVWQPLMHMRPSADVPVVQLALPFDMNDRELLELGQSLAPLRRQGICILASGNLTHNIAQLGRQGRMPWADRFDAWVEERIAVQDVDALVDWRRASPDAYLAHPDDGGHFDVLLVALGASLGSLGQVDYPVLGFEGAMSRRCIQFG